MSKMFRDNGFLTEEGKKVLQPLHDGLMEVISSKDVRDMSVAELRTLGANLAKAVGDTISEQIFARTQVSNRFEAMTDEQFEGYLRAKHGDRWMFATLTSAELERCPKLQQKEIENILKESAKHLPKFPSNGVRFK